MLDWRWKKTATVHVIKSQVKCSSGCHVGFLKSMSREQVDPTGKTRDSACWTYKLIISYSTGLETSNLAQELIWKKLLPLLALKMSYRLSSTINTLSILTIQRMDPLGCSTCWEPVHRAFTVAKPKSPILTVQPSWRKISGSKSQKNTTDSCWTFS